MEKRCSKCKQFKNITSFGIKRGNKDGLNHYCKTCECDRKKIEYKNPIYREKKKYYVIEKLYGLTKVDYIAMLSSQNNKCIVCSCDFSDENVPHIDHCHTRNVVRGILCNYCNVALGMVNDDTQRLKNLIKYINIHSPQKQRQLVTAFTA